MIFSDQKERDGGGFSGEREIKTGTPPESRNLDKGGA